MKTFGLIVLDNLLFFGSIALLIAGDFIFGVIFMLLALIRYGIMEYSIHKTGKVG